MSDTENTKEKKPRSTVYLSHHHLAVWLYPYEEEHLHKLASVANKTPSKYLEDIVMSYDGEPPKAWRDKSFGKGRCVSLCFSERAYTEIQSRRKQYGMKMVDLLMGVMYQKVSALSDKFTAE